VEPEPECGGIFFGAMGMGMGERLSRLVEGHCGSRLVDVDDELRGLVVVLGQGTGDIL
jgi:hypothetical protein